MMETSALYNGVVVHKRVRPVEHALRYHVFSLLIDCEDLPSLSRRLRLFSYNRFNLCSLHDANHGDGTPITDYLHGIAAQSGVDGIDTLDPPPLGSVDLEDAKRRVGDRMFFKGNIDPVGTLLSKTRREVREDALWRLEVGSPGGGYILSSACSVSPRVPPENLTVLVEASEEFGTPET